MKIIPLSLIVKKAECSKEKEVLKALIIKVKDEFIHIVRKKYFYVPMTEHIMSEKWSQTKVKL